jgi:alkylation response protein AidB-like acyl-CoA dehydrogenase
MFDILLSPVTFLDHMLDGKLPHEPALRDYEAWWVAEGKAISEATDRAGTPWLRMFDRFGQRVDEVLFAPEYWRMLKHGYRAGAIWRAFEDHSLLPAYLFGYVTSFFDPGLYCPYTVSLSTAAPLLKYGGESLKARFLPPLLRKDDEVWQGATWMTEAKGGSDLGAAVETIARPDGDRWLLTGDKYFASNAGADLAVVAARPDGAAAGVRGLALFLLPKYKDDGSLNYFIRRLKDKIGTRSVPTGEVELRDSEAYLLGKAEWGIYLILEVLNVSRAANSVASLALTQRALADALSFAEGRVAFGKPVLEHPLLHKQFVERLSALKSASALGWEAVRLLDEVWRETPRYSDRYHLFRLVAHLAKYWTAELAAQTAKWSIEVYAGAGTLAENRVERWLREAMILAIWEGTPHRQMLDGLEVMERKGAHRLLFQHLAPTADPQALEEIASRVDAHLALPTETKEAEAESVFRDLAAFTASTLAHRLPAAVR